MKEKIRLALVNKYKNLGFSDKAIDGILAYLESTITSDDQIEAGVAGVEGMLKAFQAEADRRATEAANKAKEKPADPAPAPSPAPVPDDTPAWAKALIDQNKTLADEIAAIKLGKSTDTRKQQLETVLKDAPDAFKKTVMKAFDRMKFEKEEDFTTYLEEVKTDSADFIQQEANTGLGQNRRPIVPTGGGSSKTASKEELDSAMNALMPHAAKAKTTN